MKLKKGFKNEVVCFTGKSKYTRVNMHKLAIKHGASISNNITGRTTLLVMGERPGSKLDRAYHKGIKIMMDDEFLRLVE